jgi:hypothetical protein
MPIMSLNNSTHCIDNDIIMIKYDERLTVYQELQLYIITNKLYAHGEKDVV